MIVILGGSGICRTEEVVDESRRGRQSKEQSESSKQKQLESRGLFHERTLEETELLRKKLVNRP